MASKFLVSTTDTDLCSELGDDAILSTVPETKGADILLYTPHGLVGWQRKAIPNDFISSFTDGRLTRAIPLLRESCTFQRIVGEGKFRFYPDTTVDMGRHKDGKPINQRFKRRHVKNMINDIEFVHGMFIDWTDDLTDTAFYLRCARAFLLESKHLGLFRRPSAKGAWVVPSAKDIDLWVLQSWPGVGPTIADAIIDRFGGQIPLMWTCSFEELCGIPRMTIAKAKTMWESLPTSAPLPVGIGTRKSQMPASELVSSVEFNALRDKLKKH